MSAGGDRAGAAGLRALLREPIVWAAPLAVVTLVLPFLLDYATVDVLANHITYAMAIAPLALIGAGLAPAAALTALAGVWLAVAPWVLGYASEGVEAWLIDLAAGIAIAVLGALSARPLRARTVDQLALFAGGDGARRPGSPPPDDARAA